MYKAVSEVEFLTTLRAIDERIRKIKLSSIEIDREKLAIQYNFVCDQTVDAGLKELILKEAEKITPPAFLYVQVGVKKIVGQSDIVSTEIFKFIKDNFPSISIFIKPTDILVTQVGDIIKYVLRLDKTACDYALTGGVIRKINDHLDRNFCSSFAGSTEEKASEETVSLLSEEVYAGEIEKIEYRTIKVQDVVVIDDLAMGDTALYIEDAVSGNVTVCGIITDITEKETKTGKPFFLIKIDDTTGRLGGLYFTRKNTLAQIKQLQVGDAIIGRGTVGEYNGRSSFTFEKINRCTFPADFVKKDKFKKKPPMDYKLIFPEPAKESVKVNSVFDKEVALPEEVLNTEYVVFDLETTGMDVMSNGITEIGAVKIKNGKVIEQFTSLIKPDYPISQEIYELTGINEELVKNSPKISAVIPDFMKFISGVTLIAHNADFDMKFIKRFAGAEEYDVNNKVEDTLDISRKLLPQLRKHDLHTVGDYFGVVFRHHRALSDAYATAEVFIELMKVKASKNG